MRTIMLAVLLVLGTLPTAASATDSVNTGNRVLVAGDTVTRLRQVAGAPDRIVRLENEQGAAGAERWEYFHEDGKLVSFVVQAGHIVSITIS